MFVISYEQSHRIDLFDSLVRFVIIGPINLCHMQNRTFMFSIICHRRASDESERISW